MATGHYAQTKRDGRTGGVSLVMSADVVKDQVNITCPCIAILSYVADDLMKIDHIAYFVIHVPILHLH